MSVMQAAAALDSAHDQGKATHLEPGGELRETTASGPAAKGKIIDVEPEDILEPVGWPTHTTPKRFVDYSRDFLTKHPERAEAWHDHYKETLANMRDSEHQAVRDALADLLALYVTCSAANPAPPVGDGSAP